MATFSAIGLDIFERDIKGKFKNRDKTIDQK